MRPIVDRPTSAAQNEKATGKARNAEELRLANERRALREKTLGCGSTEVFDAPIFKTGACVYLFGYKTSDGQRHELTCRADSKPDLFQKLRTVGVRPYKVVVT